jgi:hypothetical protein
MVERVAAAFWSWDAVGLGVAWEHEVCCVWQSRHLPSTRRQGGKTVACIEIPAVLLVGSEFAGRTGTLGRRAGSGGAWTNIAGPIERLMRIILTVTLAARRAEARLAPGHAIALADAGDGASPALFNIGQRWE